MTDKKYLLNKEAFYHDYVSRFEKPEGYSLAELLVMVQQEINGTVEASALNHFSKANEIVIFQMFLTISVLAETALAQITKDDFTQLKTSIQAKLDFVTENMQEG